MDGLSVNLKFLNEFSKLRAGDPVQSLADIGTCSLHSFRGSMKVGEIDSKSVKLGMVLLLNFSCDWSQTGQDFVIDKQTLKCTVPYRKRMTTEDWLAI